jgi:16S rRNA C1402 N4-methylase RsmH
MLEEVMQGLGVSSAASARKTPISHLANSNENRSRVFVDGTFGRGGHTRALLGTLPMRFSFFFNSYLSQ